jgi:ferredoxin-NADP reductase
LLLGVKYAPKASSFKTKLKNLSPTDAIYAGQLGGDFTLPADKTDKIVFIAGGIGVTPFRSMIKYLVDTAEWRDIVMFYSNRTQEDVAYRDLFNQAEGAVGLKTIYALSDQPYPEGWTGETGFVNLDMIKKHVPDYSDRTFYISGPNAMVESFKKSLTGAGIPRRKIITDYFPGFA